MIAQLSNAKMPPIPVYSVEGSNFAGLPQADLLKLSQWSALDEEGNRQLLNP